MWILFQVAIWGAVALSVDTGNGYADLILGVLAAGFATVIASAVIEAWRHFRTPPAQRVNREWKFVNDFHWRRLGRVKADSVQGVE